MIPVFYISNLVTYLGVVFGVSGTAAAISGELSLAMVCLIVCGVCDLFDGVFARRFNRQPQEKEMGVQLDSLADACCFGIFPVVLLYCAGLKSWYFVLLLCLYLLVVVSRLAFFNTTLQGEDTALPVAHYRGLPVTYAAFVYPLWWLLAPVLAPGLFQLTGALVCVVLMLLYVADVKIPKPRGLMYVLFSVLAVVVAVLILMGR